MADVRDVADVQETVGLVLNGGGARGAYEAGVLSVLLPALIEHNQQPRLIVGTSAGALNAVLFASLLAEDRRPEDAATKALDTWRRIDRESVIRPVLTSGVWAASRYLAEMLRLPVKVNALLDNTPLRRTIQEFLRDGRLHANIGPDRPVHAVAVTATGSSSGRTAVFVEGTPARTLPYTDDDRAIDYLPARLGPDHVLASAAVPLAFRPVLITEPAEARGWYLDGGVRLNAPIKPAIELGADHVVIVGTDPLTGADRGTPGEPDIFDTVSRVLNAALVDRMVEDVNTLRKLNRASEEHAAALEDVAGAEAGAGGRDEFPYRVIRYLYAGPPTAGELGRLATEVYDARFSSLLSRILSPDYPALSLALGHSGAAHGELLSYLFFHRDFIDESIKLGQQHAEDLLKASPSGIPWRTSS